jgi:putative transposase
MKGEGLAMKRKQFSVQQIAMALEQARAGLKVEDVCRKLGVSQNTFYRWRKKYGPMQPSEIKRLKQLEDENKRLKSIVADLTLDKQMLQEVLRKKD